jgi:hypothetical protein
MIQMSLERIKVSASKAKDIFCDGKHMAPTHIDKAFFFNQRADSSQNFPALLFCRFRALLEHGCAQYLQPFV